MKNYYWLFIGLLAICSHKCYSKEIFAKVALMWGLNNQKLMLLEACRIAHQKHYTLIEPFLPPLRFTNNKPILFSEIFDIKYFINKMRRFCKIIPFSKNLMIHVILDPLSLWNKSVKTIADKMYTNQFFDEFETTFFSALRLNEKVKKIKDTIIKSIGPDYIAIHARIEQDWFDYANKKEVPDYEQIFVPKETILARFMNSELSNTKTIYLSTAYQGKDLIDMWTAKGFLAYSAVNVKKNLNYHMASAIDFDICVNAQKFVGHSRSSFSNMVTSLRYALGKDASYIYNLNGDTIYQRYDGGIYLDPLQCINIELGPCDNNDD